MKFNGKEYRVLELSPKNKEIELDDRYTLMMAANHISLMENIEGDMCLVDTADNSEMSTEEALKWALEVVEYFYSCEID